MVDPYLECPELVAKNYTLRRICMSDSESLYFCYHDQDAVMRMNDDNCDFGFYVESQERMAETVAYWLDFYDKQCFIRFAIVDHATGEAVGTVEGFGGEIGVLRIDLASSYERVACLLEILSLAKEHFRETFGNDYLVTKAISCAVERRKALEESGWEYIDTYRGYRDYYKISLIDN